MGAFYKVPKDHWSMYLGLISGCVIHKKDIHLKNLTLAFKKTIIRNWLKYDLPTSGQDIVEEMYSMERLTHYLLAKMDHTCKKMS